MTLSLVFNDLSLRRPAPDKHTAREWTTEFVRVLKTAVDHDVNVLRMRYNFGDLILSPGYPMRAWFGDKRVSREESDFVLSYSTRYKFIRPYDEDLRGDEEFQSGKLSFEGRFGGEQAEGLGFAHLLNGLALSILSEPCWDTHSLELDCEELEPDSSEISRRREILPHVSRSRHVAVDHAGLIAERIRTGVRPGSDLLRNTTTLFPNLVFCYSACKQIEELTASSIYLPRILDRLFELEKLTSSWEGGNFNYRQIHNASPESPSTMGRFGDRREFVCPDGQRRTFEWHLKGLPNAWRIYIVADIKEKKILIGYVGKHLPTASDPT